MTPIQAKYQELGGESSFLGPSVSSEISTPNRPDVYQEFQHGIICHSPKYGTCVMKAWVIEKWRSDRDKYIILKEE